MFDDDDDDDVCVFPEECRSAGSTKRKKLGSLDNPSAKYSSYRRTLGLPVSYAVSPNNEWNDFF